MLRQILIACLMLWLGISYAQNSTKPPPSPFSFQNGSTQLNNENSLPSAGLPTTQAIVKPDVLPSLTAESNSSITTEKDETSNVLDNLTEKISNKFTEKINLYAQTLIK